jgi:hypothetical protein
LSNEYLIICELQSINVKNLCIRRIARYLNESERNMDIEKEWRNIRKAIEKAT